VRPSWVGPLTANGPPDSLRLGTYDSQSIIVSPDLRAIPARARVVLRAAELEDDQIAAELLLRRKDVIHWSKRFAVQGIRGLWDPPGPGPKQRVSAEKRRALIWDVLYGAAGMHLGASRPAPACAWEMFPNGTSGNSKSDQRRK